MTGAAIAAALRAGGIPGATVLTEPVVPATIYDANEATPTWNASVMGDVILLNLFRDDEHVWQTRIVDVATLVSLLCTTGWTDQ